MFGTLTVLGFVYGLLWYLKAPRMVYGFVFMGFVSLIFAARFLLPETHPVRVHREGDLDGLVVFIFISVAALGYTAWFRSLKLRRHSIEDPKQNLDYVLIEDDLTLCKEVEAHLNRETFSILQRGKSGEIQVSCRVVIDADIALLGLVYFQSGISDSKALRDLAAQIETESVSRGAKLLVAELLPVDLKPVYESVGFTEFASIKAGDQIRISMRKDLT